MAVASRIKRFIDFHTAWWWLHGHPIFSTRYTLPNKKTFYDSHFEECLDMTPVKVNPDTNRIDNDESKNSATRIWLESGPWAGRNDPVWRKENKKNPGCIPDWFKGGPTHDTKLDCGGATYEEAIVTLANKVLKKYGDYPRD